MNTKQVLYNALKVQLDAKEADCNKYINEVYNPAINQLSTKIGNWFVNNLKTHSKTILFTGNRIEFEYGDGWGKRIDIDTRSSWNNDKQERKLELSWRSGNYTIGNDDYKTYLSDLSLLADNLETIDINFSEWRKEYVKIEKEEREYRSEFETLKTALSKLSTEISTDIKDAMKEIGFTIKSFKQDVTLNWDYKGDTKDYYLHIREKSIQLQYGRSQYDMVWVNGFKVLGKKGNKYQIEAYREGASQPQNYNVLEKKFEYFIEEVNRWENSSADDRKARAERDLASRTK